MPKRARQASSQWLGQTRALGWIQSQVHHADAMQVRGNSLRCASPRRLGAQPALDSVTQWRIQAVVAEAGQWQVLSGAAAQSVGVSALKAVRICLMEQANSACQTGINEQWMTPQPPTAQP